MPRQPAEIAAMPNTNEAADVPQVQLEIDR